MNDISRINPELAIKTLKKWTKIKDKNMDWVVKHALRSLIKQGLPEALNILGYNSKANISVKNFKLSPKKINEGEKINLSFKIKNDSAKAENIVVDYNIHYLKSNGTHSIKVFKLKNLKINKNETISISKNITIKKVTTRKHYSGEHKLSIQINGKPHLEKRFSLIC